MGFWNTIRGTNPPPANNLDALFGLSNAAITLETALGITPTGVGAVCFRAADGAAFAQTRADVVTLLDSDADGPPLESSTDSFGFSWLISRQDDVSLIGTDLHAINTSLEEQGFGPSLLCSTAVFATSAGSKVALVYLYKRGTFYPFAPLPGEKRDNLLEIQLRDALAGELRIEPDTSRWLALWGAPGL